MQVPEIYCLHRYMAIPAMAHCLLIATPGNLPFTATEPSVRKHFTTVQPTSIRHRLDRQTGKSRGFAFLEFEAYDRMKTCLKLYHHSSFDDGQSPSRKLNVELTYVQSSGLMKMIQLTEKCWRWWY